MLDIIKLQLINISATSNTCYHKYCIYCEYSKNIVLICLIQAGSTMMIQYKIGSKHLFSIMIN